MAADEIIALPKLGSSSGEMVPVRARWNGDSPASYGIAVSSGTASGIRVAFALNASGSGASQGMETVDLNDGTYALKIDEN